MGVILKVSQLDKVYAGSFHALQAVDLEIYDGEIFALLGPNGAGKTTLIGTICGLCNPTQGQISIAGYDIVKDYRKTRSLVGLVPQELNTDAFETVWNTVCFSRGLFNKPADPQFIERVLRDLSLWDKAQSRLYTLSGGMKRRVMIAKALAHEPKILFLDEPSAGVDVDLRKSMWDLVRGLQVSGVTIVLTTHYIQEAEEMADRVGVINQGKIIVVEEKSSLMKKLGTKRLVVNLRQRIEKLPQSLSTRDFVIDGESLVLTYDSQKDDNELEDIFATLRHEKIKFQDIETRQSSLEDIFVELVST